MNLPLASSDFSSLTALGFALLGWMGWISQATRPRVNLRRLERKIDALLAHQGIELPNPLSSEVQRLAGAPGKKIAAIKLHREQAGLSLAEAKAAVEEHGL